MADINHRRKNRKPVNQRYDQRAYHNGYAQPENKGHPAGKEYSDNGHGAPFPIHMSKRLTQTDFLDKSLHGWGRKSELADRVVGAGISNDFSNGTRGMARSVRGAKKFVRTRIRFHEKMAVQKLAHAHTDHED